MFSKMRKKGSKGKCNTTVKTIDIYNAVRSDIPLSQWRSIIRAVFNELHSLLSRGIDIRIPKFGQITHYHNRSCVKRKFNKKGEQYFTDSRQFSFSTGEKKNGYYIYMKLINKTTNQKLHYAYFKPTRPLCIEIKKNVYDGF